MRRANFALLTALKLAEARTSFSIHDDLLSFPQYEVIFSENYISEHDAQALLNGAVPRPSATAEFSDVGEHAQLREDADDTRLPEIYELMNLPPSKYLCSIPVLDPPESDSPRDNELARAEEARELTRASSKGWEIIDSLQGACMYYMSGWWSYSFCYNQGVTQYHALPMHPNGGKPVRDRSTAEYVLGQVPSSPAKREPQKESSNVDALAEHKMLQVKGDQRYLVQKLGDGTVCDLTGRERTIEIQYHCVPGMKGDRIGWIKEVTTCAYVMTVNTARLCQDPAFLPPRETTANPISCRLILSANEASSEDFLAQQLLEEAKRDPAAVPEAQNIKAHDAAAARECPNPSARHPHDNTPAPLKVGDIVIGARHVLSAGDTPGKPPAKLPQPRNYARSTPASKVEVIARGKSKAQGGTESAMTAEELESRDLSPEKVLELKEKLRKWAGDNGWKLLVETAHDGALEIKGIVEVDDDEEEGDADGKGKRKEKQGLSEEGMPGEYDEYEDGDEWEWDDGSEEEFYYHEDL